MGDETPLGIISLSQAGHQSRLNAWTGGEYFLLCTVFNPRTLAGQSINISHRIIQYFVSGVSWNQPTSPASSPTDGHQSYDAVSQYDDDMTASRCVHQPAGGRRRYGEENQGRSGDEAENIIHETVTLDFYPHFP